MSSGNFTPIIKSKNPAFGGTLPNGRYLVKARVGDNYENLANPSARLRAGRLTISFMNGQNRENIKIGLEVEVALKLDQKTGKITRGIVAEILTNSSFHPHGIKVRLEDGQVGRVQNIIAPTS